MKSMSLFAALALGAAAQAGAQQVTVEAEAVQPTAAAAAANSNAPPDPKIAARKVEQALSTTPGLAADDVNVTTHAATVVLSGEVSSDGAASRALTVAEQAAPGVRVNSQLQVQPGADQALQEQRARIVRDVENALRRDPRTANLGVAVSVDERQVIRLHGLVPTRESRTAAEDVAGRVTGVGEISSRLEVAGE